MNVEVNNNYNQRRIKMKTFRDLRDYIHTAKRDDRGFHIIDNKWSLHIYNGLSQVNVNFKFNGVNESVANFIFDEKDEVGIIAVSNGCADYDNMIYIPIDTSIVTNGDVNQYWYKHLGNFGSRVRNLLQKI